MTVTLDDILKIFAAAGGLLVVFVSLFTASQAASKSGFDQLERAFKALEKRSAGIEKQNEEIEKRFIILEQENKDLRDWAERLVEQVEGAGMTPVPFRRSKTIPRTNE